MAALRDAGTPADAKAGWIRGLIGLVLTGSGVAALLTAASADKASDGSMMLGAGIVLSSSASSSSARCWPGSWCG